MVKYLVTCPLGQQGMAVIKYLLDANVTIHAVVRNAHNERARLLEDQGVILFEGDNDDFAVFRRAARGCKGIYLNLQPSADPNSQQRQAYGIIHACKDAKVENVVLSTACFAGDSSKWDKEGCAVRSYYVAKSEMEKAVRESGLDYTILRPAWFYANYLMPYSTGHFPELFNSGKLMHAYEEGTRMSHIDENDIGKYGAAALLSPKKFNGQEIELGSENLTIEEAAVILERVSGCPIKVKKRAPDEIAATLTSTQMFQLWANSVDLSIDSERVEQQYGIPLTKFEDYLRRERSRLRT